MLLHECPQKCFNKVTDMEQQVGERKEIGEDKIRYEERGKYSEREKEKERNMDIGGER